MNDEPDKQDAGGFVGFDFASDPTKLKLGVCSYGLSVWCRGDGHVETKPGLRLCCNFHSFMNAAGPAPIHTLTVPASDAVNGLAFYDQPTEEYVIAVCNDHSWTVPSAGNNVTPTHRGNGFAPPPPFVPYVQLVDRMFLIKNGVLGWEKITAGVYTVGSVTTFSDSSAMPVWSRIVVQNHRVLAFTADGEKVYTSDIGAAHLPANWSPTANIRVGDGDGDPTEKQDAYIDCCEHEPAKRHATAEGMQHGKPLEHIGKEQRAGEAGGNEASDPR